MVGIEPLMFLREIKVIIHWAKVSPNMIRLPASDFAFIQTLPSRNQMPGFILHTYDSSVDLVVETSSFYVLFT
jgi:hypothetical protein